MVASYRHEGAARELIHLLKYGGVPDFARHAARMVADRVPRLPLVPVPRALSRRVKYGVDPSRLIAQELSVLLDVPVVGALRPRMHVPGRAGRNRSAGQTWFQARRALDSPIVLVDDVATTGATLLAATRAIGPEWVSMAVVANSATVSSLSARDSP